MRALKFLSYFLEFQGELPGIDGLLKEKRVLRLLQRHLRTS